MKPVVYIQYQGAETPLGFVREPFHSLLIDLSKDDAALLADMSRTVSYEIRRAERDGVEMAVVADVAQFVAFYNGFAASKGLALVRAADFLGWGRQTVGIAAIHAGRPLVMHCYLVDHDIGRGRLLHSASHFRMSDTTAERNFVGRANRYLHVAAMKHLRSLGLGLYDLGGYAPTSEDPDMVSIARFKRGFGGAVVREDRLVPVSIAAWRFGGKLARRAAQKFRTPRVWRRSQAARGAEPDAVGQDRNAASVSEG